MSRLELDQKSQWPLGPDKPVTGAATRPSGPFPPIPAQVGGVTYCPEGEPAKGYVGKPGQHSKKNTVTPWNPKALEASVLVSEEAFIDNWDSGPPSYATLMGPYKLALEAQIKKNAQYWWVTKKLVVDPDTYKGKVSYQPTTMLYEVKLIVGLKPCGS